MKKQNKAAHDKHEHAANMNWLRVLDFGVEAVDEKTSNHSQQTQEMQALVFIVMP